MFADCLYNVFSGCLKASQWSRQKLWPGKDFTSTTVELSFVQALVLWASSLKVPVVLGPFTCCLIFCLLRCTWKQRQSLLLPQGGELYYDSIFEENLPLLFHFPLFFPAYNGQKVLLKVASGNSLICHWEGNTDSPTDVFGIVLHICFITRARVQAVPVCRLCQLQVLRGRRAFQWWPLRQGLPWELL